MLKRMSEYTSVNSDERKHPAYRQPDGAQRAQAP